MSFPERPRAVITGASSGLGRAIAIKLAERGARLVLGDIDEAGLEQTARLVREKGGEAEVVRCDVRRPQDVEALAELADARFGGTDIVVNNAGVAVAGAIGEVPLEDWRWQIDINLWGVIHGCHFFVPRMKKAARGWILNVASCAGLLCTPEMGPYNVTKAGVVALSETLAGELSGTGVQVSALCPTFFRTNIHKSARSSNPETKAIAEKLVTGSSWTAEQIAERALAALEAGELYVVPQRDGRTLWRAKRILGQRFYGAVGRIARSERLRKAFFG